MTSVELKILPRRDTLFLILKISFLDGQATLSRNIPLVVPLITQ